MLIAVLLVAVLVHDFTLLLSPTQTNDAFMAWFPVHAQNKTPPSAGR